MTYIEIYTKKNCPFCNHAKNLLIKKSLRFVEIPIDACTINDAQTMMQKRSGRTTVPQIFINGVHIGGSDDLHTLDNQGKLDYLLIKK